MHVQVSARGFGSIGVQLFCRPVHGLAMSVDSTFTVSERQNKMLNLTGERPILAILPIGFSA